MKVKELIDATGWDALTLIPDKQITSAYTCDLLSFAMANTQSGTAWITVQSHVNVVAVASLTGCACVIIPCGTSVSEETLEAAKTKDVCIVSAPCSAYAAAARLYRLGIGDI
ncbi:MAG: hypothetical protein WDA65_04485 [Christensenellales bacterium]